MWSFFENYYVIGVGKAADRPIKESIVEPLHRDVSSVWSCYVLSEPLYISIPTTKCSKCLSELVQHINITLLCDSDCLLVCAFKPKRSDYSMFSDGHPGRAFHRVKGLWSTSSGAFALRYTQLLLVTCPQSQKWASSLNQRSSKKSRSSSILFLNHRHTTKRFSMSAGVSLG